MCLSTYVCACVYMYVCMHVCVRMCLYVHIHVAKTLYFGIFVKQYLSVTKHCYHNKPVSICMCVDLV